jgi:hypothetical protein
LPARRVTVAPVASPMRHGAAGIRPQWPRRWPETPRRIIGNGTPMTGGSVVDHGAACSRAGCNRPGTAGVSPVKGFHPARPRAPQAWAPLSGGPNRDGGDR